MRYPIKMIDRMLKTYGIRYEMWSKKTQQFNEITFNLQLMEKFKQITENITTE